MPQCTCKTLVFAIASISIAATATAQITIDFSSATTSSTEPVARFGDTAAVPPISKVPIVITVDTDGAGDVDQVATTVTSLNTLISDDWTVTGNSALAIDQQFSFTIEKRSGGLVYQRVFQGIGTNGKNSGRMDDPSEFLDLSLDLSSVPNNLQFQLVQVGFANTNSHDRQ